MKIQDLQKKRIQTLATYDINKMLKYAVSEISDNIQVFAREINTLDEHAKTLIRTYFTMDIKGYIVSDEPDTIPDYKTLVLSFSTTSELDDDDKGNIDINSVYSVSLDDLPKDAKNHFHKQLKEIIKDGNYVKIGKAKLPLICAKVEYDNYKNDTLTIYSVARDIAK